MRLDRVPFHPLLFAAYPVLYLLAQNLQDAEPGQALPSLVVTVAATAAIFGLLRLAMKDWRKAALATSILVLLVFSYGYVYAALAEGALRGVARHRTLLPLWGMLAAGGIFLAVRARGWLPRATTVLNIAATVLVVLNAVSIVGYGASKADRSFDPGRDVLTEPIAAGARTGPRPDIYYLIFDRYGREDVLRDLLGFDNAPFVSFLESRGFYVADGSNANYAKTVFSVASSVSMDHLLGLREAVGPGSSDAAPLRSAIRSNTAARYLKRLGYSFVNVGSWWGPTSRSPVADRNIAFGGLSEFSTVLYETTAVAPVARALSDDLDVRRREHRRLLFQFDQLERTADMRGPKFVFAHILSPHAPYVVDHRGRFVTEEEMEARRGEGRNYLEQLRYVNSRVMSLVQKLQAGDDDPVIILQSDEGPGVTPGSFDQLDPERLRRKLSVFNAYSTPGIDDPELYPTITPVNTFRVIFNAYFDAGLPMLPDRTYVYRSLKDLYSFRDVTAYLAG